MTARFLIPETIQTSATDCGPAVLKALLEGHGVAVRYDRLREACATDVDGTSFDVLEGLLEQFGFETDKALVAPEDLFFEGEEQLPAVVVTRLPNGFAHFVVVWRKVGGHLLLMDPANGRRWVRVNDFLKEVLVHQMRMNEAHLRAWLDARDSFRAVLRARLARLGVQNPESLLDRIGRPEVPTRTVAALDAAARTVDVLASKGAVARGSAAASLVERLFDLASPPPLHDERFIPAQYWSALPTLNDAVYMLRGVPTIRIKATPRLRSLADAARAPPPEDDSGSDSDRAAGSPSGALRNAYGRTAPPGALLLRLMPRAMRVSAVLVVVVATLAALTEGLVAVTVRHLLSLQVYIPSSVQRLGAALAVFGLCACVWFFDASAAALGARVGRHLDVRFRVALLGRLPRLPDAYFRTRAGSDLAERFHTIHVLRKLPDVAMRWTRTLASVVAVYVGLVWLEPERALVVSIVVTLGLLVPMLVQRPLGELDMRARTHGGALAHFYLDALVGAMPVKAHRAQAAMAIEQEKLVASWGRAHGAFARFSVAAELLMALAGVLLAAVLLLPLAGTTASSGSMLLVTYWALSIPLLGNELAILSRHATTIRNRVMRLVEPLDVALEPSADAAGAPSVLPPAAAPGAARIELRGVSVRTSPRHSLLEDVDLDIPAGAHVAVVGTSGAGKSTLAGLLLGWHRPASGTLLVDGHELTPSRLVELRRRTAWVDPGAQLWNRSIAENITYGETHADGCDLSWVVNAAELAEVLELAPGGLRAQMGDAGALFSGGEGQRVRFARALCRRSADLVVLDEAFRGLDQIKRARLLGLARQHWRSSTLFCITHDVSETLGFDHVLVVESGRVVEQGVPGELAARTSRYRELLEKERELEAALWSSPSWRRTRLERGTLAG